MKRIQGILIVLVVILSIGIKALENTNIKPIEAHTNTYSINVLCTSKEGSKTLLEVNNEVYTLYGDNNINEGDIIRIEIDKNNNIINVVK